MVFCGSGFMNPAVRLVRKLKAKGYAMKDAEAFVAGLSETESYVERRRALPAKL